MFLPELKFSFGEVFSQSKATIIEIIKYRQLMILNKSGYKRNADRQEGTEYEYCSMRSVIDVIPVIRNLLHLLEIITISDANIVGMNGLKAGVEVWQKKINHHLGNVKPK
jgi:hypothetical protein